MFNTDILIIKNSCYILKNLFLLLCDDISELDEVESENSELFNSEVEYIYHDEEDLSYIYNNIQYKYCGNSQKICEYTKIIIDPLTFDYSCKILDDIYLKKNSDNNIVYTIYYDQFDAETCTLNYINELNLNLVKINKKNIIEYYDIMDYAPIKKKSFKKLKNIIEFDIPKNLNVEYNIKFNDYNIYRLCDEEMTAMYIVTKNNFIVSAIECTFGDGDCGTEIYINNNNIVFENNGDDRSIFIITFR
jgi:hypothetical protein